MKVNMSQNYAKDHANNLKVVWQCLFLCLYHLLLISVAIAYDIRNMLERIKYAQINTSTYSIYFLLIAQCQFLILFC